MSDMFFTDRARQAAWHILRHTSLGPDIADHCYDDGRLLTITPNADDYAILSTGQRLLLAVLEQLAGVRTTLTLHDLGHRLDEPSRRTVCEAYTVFLLGEEAAA